MNKTKRQLNKPAKNTFRKRLIRQFVHCVVSGWKREATDTFDIIIEESNKPSRFVKP